MKEEWKWIKGFEGLYEISNTGKIRHTSSKYIQREMSMKNSKGWYLTVRLFDGNKWHTKRVHRLVYETFAGEIPNDFHIHHIDENKQNNRLTNLMLLSKSDHMKLTANKPSAYEAMVNKNRFGQKHILQFTLDGKFVQEHINAKEAEKVTGVCSRNINQVANKAPYNARGSIRKQAGGFIWKYKEKGVVK